MFSGSGALALESISRGAKSATLCDISRKAIQIIKANIQKTHLEKQVEIINSDYKKCLEKIKTKKYDIIFLDPPYKTKMGIEAINIITQNNMLKQDGIIVFETDQNEYVSEAEKLAKVIDIRKYGRVTLVFLGRKE